jgi:SNF2 family DNA or RNA helicase
VSLTLRKRKSLFPYQHEALSYARQRSRVALFMEMRLGKTLVCIRWLSDQTGPFLIVAPVEALSGWMDELQGDGISLDRIRLLYGTKKQRLIEFQSAPSDAWCLINYEGLRVLGKEIKEHYWNAVILDESTRIRNPKASVTKYCLASFNNVQRKAVLTGLPDPEGPMDYFCQMAFLHGSFMGSHNFWMFRHKYFTSDARGWEWHPRAGSVDAIKREVHGLSYRLSRDKANIGSKKLYQKRIVEMNTAQLKAYKQVKNEFAYEGKETKWVVSQITWLARLAGGFDPEGLIHLSTKKLNELCRLLKEDLQNEQVLVWFRFNAELMAAVKRLSELGVKVAYITGKIDKKDRPSIVKAFQSHAVQVLAMQVKCGRFGLDCSAADTAIYYSNPYDGEDRAQTEDRIVHPKKTKPLLLIDLISQGSIDEDVIRILKRKRISSRQFMRALISDLADKWKLTHGLKKVNRIFPADLQQ